MDNKKEYNALYGLSALLPIDDYKSIVFVRKKSDPTKELTIADFVKRYHIPLSEILCVKWDRPDDIPISPAWINPSNWVKYRVIKISPCGDYILLHVK